MTDLRKAAQQALEALYEETAWFGPTPKGAAAITALRDALAQQPEPAQEPVATLIAQRDALRAELKEATEAINDPAVNNLRTLPESIRVLCVQRDALLEALKEAATSLETVGRLAGKSDYLGDAGERIPTYMGRHDEVREYATSRAGVARAAIKAVEGEKT